MHLLPRITAAFLLALLLALAAGAVPGCAALSGSGSSLAVQSSAEPLSLSTEFQTAYYHHTDNNTADIYLSDLPYETLADPAADLRTLTGNLVHIHLFLMPTAGRTPIEPSAFNFTIRHAVLTGDRAGLYSGGGFMLPTREPGRRWFTGSVRDATVRLSRGDAGFADRLGVATVSGTVSARRDQERARTLAARFDRLVAALPEPAPEN